MSSASEKQGQAPIVTSPRETGAEEAADLVRSLGATALFKGIHRPGLQKIAAIACEEAYPSGELIFREGEPGEKLYFILEGKIRISRNVSGMGEEALAVLNSGDAFGEMSIIDDVARSADARVHESCRMLVVTREAMEDLMFLHKDLAYEILWNFVRILSERLRETNDKMTFLSVTGKF
ncbi:MAG: cyclic nucleotide-binding domain-containing protein [Myxococcota bacterium]